MSTMNGYFDVTDHGAIGDGVTDDTKAIRATEGLAEAKGGIVYFPPGTYLVSGTINVAASGVEWRGAGAGASQILSASGILSPSVVVVGSSTQAVNFVTIRNLAFSGNGYAELGEGSPVILFNGGFGHRVLNCYFTYNTNVTIEFEGISTQGGADAEVSGCNFYSVGYNDGSHYQQPYKTEAVRIGKNVSFTGVRVNNNHLYLCYQGGIQGFSGAADMSHNYGSSIVGSLAFCGDQNDNRMAFNSATNTITLQAAGAGSQALDAAQSRDFCIVGNNCSYGDGDGIVTNGWRFGVIIANNVWDNNKQGNDCGIQLDGQSAPEPAVVVLANNSFDDRTTSATQLIGIHMFSQTGAPDGEDCVVLGNSTANNLTDGIFQDTNDEKVLLGDDSNVVFGNSQWPEGVHSTSQVETHQTSWGSPIANASISPGSMMLTTGLRVVAGGSTSGANGTKHFALGFGSLTQVDSIEFDSPYSAGSWQLIAVIMNNQGSSQKQAVTVLFFYDGVLLATNEAAFAIDTTSTASVSLSVYVDSSSDSITNDYFFVERC